MILVLYGCLLGWFADLRVSDVGFISQFGLMIGLQVDCVLG